MLAMTFYFSRNFQRGSSSLQAKTDVATTTGSFRKEPPSFSGNPWEFMEWTFLVDEALHTRQPTDTVAFVASFFARKRLEVVH